MDELLSIYIKDIKKNNLIDKDDQNELALDWFNNKSEVAFGKLVKNNLRYVVKLATKYSKRYVNIGLTMSDFVQAGNVGLMIGLKKYDPNKGASVINFCHNYIRTELDRLIGSNIDLFKRSTSQIDRYMAYRRQKIMDIVWANEDDKEILRNNLAKETGFSLKQIKKQEDKHSVKVFSIHNNLIENDTETFEDFIEDTDSFENKVFDNLTEEKLLNKINEYILKLKPKSAECIKQYFLEEKTLQEIGKGYNKLSRERIRQIVLEALKNLKFVMEKDKFNYKDYLKT